MVVYCDFIAGCFGGACGTIVGHPFDTIKIWQQFGNRRISHSVNEIIMRNNGLNGFFRGMAFPVMTSGMLNSILFGIYGNELRRMQSMCATEVERRSQWDRHVFWAGSEAGFIHSFVACPFELVKIRLQTQNHHGIGGKFIKHGPLECIKQVYRNEGLFGFYRGWTAMFCRDVFPYGIYMVTYDHMSKTLANSEWVLEKKKQSPRNYSYVQVGIPIASGVTAGLLSWVWAIPFDVIKTYMQAELDPNKHRQMSVMFRNKRIKYGWRVFYRGTWIILVRSLPANAATFIGFQYALNKCQYFSDVKPI